VAALLRQGFHLRAVLRRTGRRASCFARAKGVDPAKRVLAISGVLHYLQPRTGGRVVEGTALERRSGVSYRVPRTAKLTENSSIRAALPRARFGALLGHPIAFGSKIGSKLGMIESELANASPSIFNRRHGLDTDTCGPCRSGCNALVLGSLPVAMLARGRAALVRCHRRLGPGATTDCLRRALHCTVCGRKGGTITTVSRARFDLPPQPMPIDRVPAWALLPSLNSGDDRRNRCDDRQN
jgi:hypothetical protein